MAANLCRSGNKLRVFDLNKFAVDALVGLGAERTSSPRQAAEGVDVTITMLPANEHVQACYLHPETGILAGAPNKGALMLDSSTISPDVSKLVAAEARKRGFRFCDAPVSGGVGGATAGTLTFMVGSSSEQDFLDAKPILNQMGKNIVHCGDIGTGQVAKICNNMLLAISMIGTAEAMNLGVKLGMDRTKLAGVLNTSSGRCWSSEVYNPAPGVLPNVPSSKVCLFLLFFHF